MAAAKDAPPVPPKKATTPQEGFVKYYLVLYNTLSALGWATVLVLTLNHLFNIDGQGNKTAPITSKSTSSVFFSFFPYLKNAIQAGSAIESRLPLLLQPVYRRAGTTFARIGTKTALVQSFALLEITHVLVEFVRSPLQTTIMQVASRIFLVWGVCERFQSAQTHPMYASMVFAWSFTEVVRYSYYACNLLGYEPDVLTYLRYTTFYVLYPLGASSEAMLIYSTLPSSSPIPSFGGGLSTAWSPADYGRGALFLIWWPGLYVMYTYMIAQRRKVLGKARLTPANASTPVAKSSKSKSTKTN